MDVIVFRAFRPKTQQPVRVSPLPVMKAGGKHFTGQGKQGYYENLTKNEKDEMNHVITPEYIKQIQDGTTLDLSNPIDAADWAWIQKHPYIVLDRKEGQSSRHAVFYVENKAREAEDKVSKDKVITMAKSAMYQASREQLDVVAKAFGHPSPEGFSEKEVQSYLTDIIESTPDAVIEAFKPENQGSINVRSLLSDFVRHKIIVKSRGSFFYGGEHGTHLGRSEESVVEFLMDAKNGALVDAMTSQMDELSKSELISNG